MRKPVLKEFVPRKEEDQINYTSLQPECFDEEAKEIEKKGWSVLRADNRTLLLDLDTTESFITFTSMIAYIHRHFDVESYSSWPSSSGPPHRHAQVKLREDLPPAARNALELVLGSDPVRGLLNIKRLEAGIEEPSRLFVPPGGGPPPEDEDQ